MIKFFKHDLSASVLATVLVVSTLLLVGVLMVIELWNFDLVRYNIYHQGEQARANVESGFLLYSLDSTLSYRWEGDSSVLLFGQREESRVCIIHGNVGECMKSWKWKTRDIVLSVFWVKRPRVSGEQRYTCRKITGRFR